MAYGSVKVDSIVTTTKTVTVDDLLDTGDLSTSTSSTSTTTAATSSAVKSAYDLANAALPKSGGTMTGAVTFAAGQTISGYAALATAQTFTAAQRGAYTTLTDAAMIAIDMSLSNQFQVTLGGNRVLDAPTNVVAGQTGVIRVVQSASGSNTLSFNSIYKFSGGTAPTLTTTANAVDLLAYHCESATRIAVRFIGDVK